MWGACSSGCGAAIWLSAILGTLSKAPVMGELVSPVMRQPQRHRLCGGDIVFRLLGGRAAMFDGNIFCFILSN